MAWLCGPALPRDRPPTGPPFRRTALRRTALRRTAQNFALFFPLPLPFSFFFSLSGVFSWNFGGVFEGRDPQMYTFGLSGCRVKPRRLRKRTKMGAGGKKARNFGPPTLRGPPFGVCVCVCSCVLVCVLVCVFVCVGVGVGVGVGVVCWCWLVCVCWCWCWCVCGLVCVCVGVCVGVCWWWCACWCVCVCVLCVGVGFFFYRQTR